MRLEEEQERKQSVCCLRGLISLFQVIEMR